MNVKTEMNLRTCLVYLICVGVAWLLTSVVWGVTCGLVGGLSIALNPEYQKEVASFMQKKGVSSDASRSDAREAYQRLSNEDKQELMKMSRDVLSDVNWFPVTVFVSAVVFGIVGFFGGLTARAWLLAGAVPALSFLTNNLVIRFPMAKDLPMLEKVIVVIFAQVTVCYVLAYWGARIGLKRKQKKETANKQIQTIAA